MKIQIDDVVRDATNEEIEIIQNQQTISEQRELDRQTFLETRKIALQKLGLTDQEINTVLGL